MLRRKPANLLVLLGLALASWHASPGLGDEPSPSPAPSLIPDAVGVVVIPTGLELSAAVAQAASQLAYGGTIRLAPGIYPIEDTVTVPPRIKLIGAGRGATTLQCEPSMNGQVALQVSAANPSDVELADFTLLGPDAPPGPSSPNPLAGTSIGILVKHAHGVTLRDLRVQFFDLAGIEIFESFYGAVGGIDARYNGIGLHTYAANSSAVSGVHLQYNLIGADNLSGESITAEGNYWVGLRYGGPLLDGTPGPAGGRYNLTRVHLEQNNLADVADVNGLPAGDIQMVPAGVGWLSIDGGWIATRYTSASGGGYRAHPTYNLSGDFRHLSVAGAIRLFNATGEYAVVHAAGAQPYIYDSAGVLREVTHLSDATIASFQLEGPTTGP